MVTLNEYYSLDDFDTKRGRALEALLYEDETFIYAIDVYDAILLPSTRASKLVLTDQRVIAFKRAFIKESSRDFSLDDLVRIEYEKGMVMRKITIEGHGISDDYQVLEDLGRTFATAVREQKSRLEDGKDPLEMTPESSSGGSRSVSGSPSKYGSLKAHLVVAALTVWWSAGLGNLAYLGYCWYQYDG